MPNRRRFHFLAAGLLALAASSPWAAETRTYSDQEFDRLTAAGRPVVLDVHATWCPTCKAQKPIIDALLAQPAYRDVTLLTIDFDSAKPTLRRFKVASQSTLIAFKGRGEVARSVGDTSREGLEALFAKSVR